jgi:hypothetical protein
MVAGFAGRCTTCGESFPAGSAILWAKGAGATHGRPDLCDAARAARVSAPPAAPAPNVAIGAVLAFLTAAKARGLKAPAARFLAPSGGELRLSLAGGATNYPGAMQVKIDSAWIGRVMPDGTVAGPLSRMADVVATLGTIAADPAAAAAAYGALMGRCSFCNLALTDAGSVEVGYGPVCAKHWGLPHHPQGTPTLLAMPVSA